MRYALTLLSLLLVACSNPNPKTTVIIPEKPIDTSKYSILKFDAIRDSLRFGKNVKAAGVSDTDIAEIETLIAKKAGEYNKAEAKEEGLDNHLPYDNLIHHAEKYYKQIIAVANLKGEKIAWVNCLCAGGKSNKNIVLVADGGSCFFQIEINLTTNRIIGFWVNGLG